ncbi:MAG: hypothetical protein AAGK14_02005 [Verrucomicrobiota bacterium]
MSVTEVEAAVAKFSPEELVEFEHWFYIYKEVQKGIAEADAGLCKPLSLERMKAELNRRLANKQKSSQSA